MFTGLSAFPISPFTLDNSNTETIDVKAYATIIERLVSAQVDSICTMGSTGLYPYLKPSEIKTLASNTVALSGDIPVMAGIGALRLVDVLKNAETVQQAGVDAVLLAPVSYHPLFDEEVFYLYSKVAEQLSVPMCIYENPGTTQFTFSDELYRELCQLPNVGAIKIPGMPFANEDGARRLKTLRELIPEHVAIGVSGDKFGAAGMSEGCDLWFSVLGGLFPHTVKEIITLAQSSKASQASAHADNLQKLWDLFATSKGGMRVMATAAVILGIADNHCLPKPLHLLSGEKRKQLEELLKQLALD